MKRLVIVSFILLIVVVFAASSCDSNITEEDIAWLRENFPNGIPSIVD